jgi:hypothetical protein
MRTDIIRGALLGILLLGFTAADIALADDSEKGCSNIGTWLGVASPGDTRLTGWSLNVMGKSEKMGTNIIDFPTFDPKLEPDFAGVPVYIAKTSGYVDIVDDCQYQHITVVMEVFLPDVSPFDGEPEWVIPLGEFYGYRANVDLT